jgi:hypothetical protein
VLQFDSVRGAETAGLHWGIAESRMVIGPRGSHDRLIVRFGVVQKGPGIDCEHPGHPPRPLPIVPVQAMEKKGCHCCRRWGRCFGQRAENPKARTRRGGPDHSRWLSSPSWLGLEVRGVVTKAKGEEELLVMDRRQYYGWGSGVGTPQ